MLIGPHLPPESVPLIRLAVERTSAEGEQTLAVLGLVRARTEVSALAVTTRRLLTLGRAVKDFPMHQEFFSWPVDEVEVEKDSLLARGRVRVRTAGQVHVLGSLTPRGDGLAIALLDRALAGVRWGEDADRPALPDPGMPTIAVPRSPAAGAPLDDQPEDDDTQDHGLQRTGRHPLVGQLAELAGMHQQGSLTDEEFASAKARLLAGQS